ncbi:uncharacterized protein LOC120545303 [Perca fluviatilis]|uniref:uncharacterized protein LOC120545303 n=1 Tax=Perca fluviatilis TaxID=8168 RepID=UPI00196473E7|nr:uncharacterized protein LOC120545303 [Perca fluviatilis]XP_039635478.1 uncharacterized protein LOC120545303 [Perca fluviatilis]XP_039635479.1 uncharacterized protein LOC120545303 [Perca fluviatilis]
MASTPTTRRSKQLPPPPDLSELMNKPKEHAASFIREFDSREPKIRPIIREFREIAAKVRKTQERTDEVRRVGAGALGVAPLGMPFGLLAGAAAVARAEATALALAAAAVAAAAVAGGARALSPRAAAGAIVAAAGAAAAAGGAGVVAAALVIAAGLAICVAGANVTKGMSESGSVKKVEELAKEFMKIVEPLKNDLEEIKRTCEKLEQRSAEVQAEITLREMEELQRSLSIPGRSDGVLSTMEKVFTLTATPEEDRKLRDSIIQSADLCQKVIDDLEKMKEDLKEQ